MAQRKRAREKELGNYRLQGWTGHLRDGGNENDYWAKKELDTVFTAENDNDAIRKARKQIDGFFAEHKELAPNPSVMPDGAEDYSHSRYDNNTCEFELSRIIWEYGFVSYEPSKPSVVARPAAPAQSAHFRERRR